MRNKPVITTGIILLFVAVVTVAGENYRWLWAREGKSVCNDTVMAGITGVVPTYVARVHYKDRTYPAYVNPTEESAAVYVDAFSRTRVTAMLYEVLCGNNFGWLTLSNTNDISKITKGFPVGHHANGDVIYACRYVRTFENTGEMVVGKVDKDLRSCTIPTLRNNQQSCEDSRTFELLVDLSADLDTINSNFSWTWSRDGDVTPCASNQQVIGGAQGPNTISLGRVHHFSALIPAHIKLSVAKAGSYTVGDEIYRTNNYEVLCGNRLVWQQVTIDEDSANKTLPQAALAVGYTSNGTVLHMCRTISTSVLNHDPVEMYNRRDYPPRRIGQFIPGVIDPNSLLCNTTGQLLGIGKFVQQNSTYEILTSYNL